MLRLIVIYERKYIYFNTGTLFGNEIDIDYAKISVSTNVPRIETNLIKGNTSFGSPLNAPILMYLILSRVIKQLQYFIWFSKS